jgi:hypothetical protein
MRRSAEAIPVSGSDEFTIDLASVAGRRVLISIPTGFQIRQFIHSGVIRLLRKYDIAVSIVSPSHSGEEFVKEVPEGVEIHALNFQEGSLQRRYWAARQHLLLGGHPTDTLRQKRVDLRRRLPSAALLAQIGNPLLRWFPPLRRRVLRWERFILRDKALDELLSTKMVDLILLGTPGYMTQDGLLMHAAVRRRIPVVAAVMSWDNLSSKGFINPSPDRLLVWSDYMRREAIDLQGIPTGHIVETGSPVHDAFANSSRFGSRAENLCRLGLDPERRLIFYGTNHGGFIADEIEVVKRIVRWVESDALGVPCQLWVRLHPQAVTGIYKIPTDPYLALASQLVKIEFPPVRDSRLSWELPKDDLEHLVGLLRDADVVINSGSLSIDAAVLDRPVICIAYDPIGDLPYDRSVRRYYDYTHMLNLTQCRAVQLAVTPDDLWEKIKAYLQQPGLDGEGRRRLVEEQVGQVDGKSAERIVRVIVQVLSQSSQGQHTSL